jgi:alkylation response protein AidB-like acyl-CoA dehydrogenase
MTLTPVSDEELIAVAEAWSQKLPERSAEIETARRLPVDISKAFADSGIYHALVPQQYGGSEAHPASFVEVIKQVATGDGSAGWNVMIGMTTGLLSASLPDEFASQIYGGGRGMMSIGATAPMGRAEVVEGGYQVKGRWPFGSGCQNADWICGGSLITENGENRIGKHGAPEVHLMMFEKSQVLIEDTWNVSGLCGTGSHHYSVDDVFVPEGRSVVLGNRARVGRPLYQFPMLGLLALGVSSVSLGIGYKAVNTFVDLAEAKTPTGSRRSLAERAQVQSFIAESIADLESSEAYIKSVIEDAWVLAQQGERLSTEVKAKLRLAAVNATQRSVSAVDRLYQAGGGSSIYHDNELQRCFRDVHVSTQHIMVGLPVYEVVGRVELGLAPGSLL